MTTTLQINKLLKHDKFCKKKFGGTWPVDMVPTNKINKTKRHFCFVVNSSPSWSTGSHWTAIWASKKTNGSYKVEHFCSYGLKPVMGLHAKLVKLDQKYKYNKITLQSISSDLCGYYCILFLKCKCRGISTKKMMSCFSKNVIVNDVIVYNLIDDM